MFVDEIKAFDFDLTYCSYFVCTVLYFYCTEDFLKFFEKITESYFAIYFIQNFQKLKTILQKIQKWPRFVFVEIWTLKVIHVF